MDNSVIYRRIQHAAHYQYAFNPVGPEAAKTMGHDLEQWDCPDCKRGRSGYPLRPEGVPMDAEYHSGYLAKDGSQRWLFVRRAPMTGTCERCEKRVSL